MTAVYDVIVGARSPTATLRVRKGYWVLYDFDRTSQE